MFSINGEEWNIVKVSEYHPYLYRSDNTLSIAATDNTTKTIYINENVKGALLWKVLCHEITHAAMFSYNVYLTIEQEELLADLIATYGDEIILITNKIFNKIRDR